jgi:hypothetical protein
MIWGHGGLSGCLRKYGGEREESGNEADGLLHANRRWATLNGTGGKFSSH